MPKFIVTTAVTEYQEYEITAPTAEDAGAVIDLHLNALGTLEGVHVGRFYGGDDEHIVNVKEAE